MAVNLLPRDGEAYLHEAALPSERANALFATLLDAVAWRQEHVRIMGRRIAAPRLTAWHGDVAYAYSGVRHAPAAWTPPLREIKAAAEACAGAVFNAVLLNRYRDGRDGVGWHADDEAGVGPVIAGVSLGAVRRFALRHRDETALKVSLDLPHGSCLVMAGATQRFWRHAVPKTRRPVGERVSLTFRWMETG